MPKVAIVGASRGIGFEFARQYLGDGWSVHASARQENDLQALRELGAMAHQADVTDEASLKAMAKAIIGSLDLLIINAGIGSRERKLAEVDPDNWMQVMSVNALGPLLAARTVGTKVCQGGKLVALTSMMGSIADNSGGAWSYRMSKAALNMGMSCLAIELKPRDVTVAVLHPGWVRTDMGGEEAPLSPTQSVMGMRAVIDQLERSGGFYDYSGRELSW